MGDAEVQNPGAARGQDDVLRLDVPVDDAGGMNGRESLGRTGGKGVQGSTGERTVRGNVPIEGEPRGIGGGQPRRRGFDVGRDQGYEARALDTGGELHFPTETSPELRVVRLSGVNDLDRDPETGVVEAGVHRAHAP